MQQWIILASYSCLFICDLSLQQWVTWLPPSAIILIVQFKYKCMTVSELLICTPVGTFLSTRVLCLCIISACSVRNTISSFIGQHLYPHLLQWNASYTWNTIRLSSYFLLLLWFSYTDNHVSFISSFLILISYISFSCFISLARDPSMRMNMSSKSGHLCLDPCLRGNVSNWCDNMIFFS